MPKRSSDYHSWLISQLADPEEAVHYLNAAIEDSPAMFLKALRNVAEAHKMAKVAKKAKVTREALYKTLSGEGNPRLGTLRRVLKAVGLHIIVAPTTAATPSHRSLSLIGSERSAISETDALKNIDSTIFDGPAIDQTWQFVGIAHAALVGSSNFRMNRLKGLKYQLDEIRPH
jgi:probable addiction module antidote protein